jgi:Fur family peroxide stress response transcriptional regulator
MWHAGSHPTVSDIHLVATRADPTISLATVYKTLQLFIDIGLVLEMGFRDESTRYDPETDVHVNLICNECGSIQDLPCASIAKLLPDIIEEQDFRVLGYRLEVHGICSNCR